MFHGFEKYFLLQEDFDENRNQVYSTIQKINKLTPDLVFFLTPVAGKTNVYTRTLGSSNWDTAFIDFIPEKRKYKKTTFLGGGTRRKRSNRKRKSKNQKKQNRTKRG